MDKAMKIPLIALSILTTQLLMQLGNTTISKSAEHKPTGNNHKEISQTYYDRQMKIETMPVMIEQEKPTELRSQSNSDLRNELNYEEQRIERRGSCYKKFMTQSSFGSSPAYYRVVGDDMYYVYVDIKDVCSLSWTKIGVIGVQRTEIVDINGYPQVVYYREKGKLCRYIKLFKGADVNKDCFSYKQY